MIRKLRRPSPAMIVACLALFVALSGSTYAAVKLKAGSVKTKTIKNAAVTEAKIAGNAVSTGKIADSAVTSAKLGAGSVTKGKLAASGAATNTSTYALGGFACTLETTFAAPGVQPGDVVAVSFQTTVPTGVLSVSPGEDTAGDGVIRLELCENVGVAANVTPGSLKIDWVAIR